MTKLLDASYDVSQYCIMLERRSNGTIVASRRVQAGFDVSIYHPNAGNGHATLPDDYVLRCAILRDIVKTISGDSGDCCSVELIPLPSTVILNTRNHLQEERVVRIRISHYRGLDRPADVPEQRALAEVETQLRTLGAARR